MWVGMMGRESPVSFNARVSSPVAALRYQRYQGRDTRIVSGQGYDSLDHLFRMTHKELMDLRQITSMKPGHFTRLLITIQQSNVKIILTVITLHINMISKS